MFLIHLFFIRYIIGQYRLFSCPLIRITFRSRADHCSSDFVVQEHLLNGIRVHQAALLRVVVASLVLLAAHQHVNIRIYDKVQHHQQIGHLAEWLVEVLPVAKVLRQDNTGHLRQPADNKGYAQERHQSGESNLFL